MRNNKGFSLVELIIVIAILAILAGAVTPALLKYINRARKSNDVTYANNIKKSIETVVAKEKNSKALVPNTAGGFYIITFKTSGITSTSFHADAQDALDEILELMNNGIRGPRFKKDNQDYFEAYIDENAEVTVFVVTDPGAGPAKNWELAPATNDYYK